MSRTVYAVVHPALMQTVRRTAENYRLPVVELAPEAAEQGLDEAGDAVVVVDLSLPNGSALLRAARERAPDATLIAIAAFGSNPDPILVADCRATVAFRPLVRSGLARLIEPILGEAPPDAPLVLVIDDEPRNLMLTEVRLKAAGFNVVTALGGARGIALAEARLPSAIVCDVLMPEPDGFAVLEAIRAHPDLAATPVFLVTQLVVDPTSRKLAADMGVTRYIEGRSPTLSEVVAAVREATRRPLPLPDSIVDRDARLLVSMRRTAERLASVNLELSRAAALSDAEREVLGSIARHASKGPVGDLYRAVLDSCVESGILALAAYYERDSRGELAPVGAALNARGEGPRVPDGHLVDALLDEADEDGPIAVPGSRTLQRHTVPFLLALQADSALLVRVRAAGEDLGVLLLVMHGSSDLSSSDWRTFASTVATYLGLALLLRGGRAPPLPPGPRLADASS